MRFIYNFTLLKLCLTQHTKKKNMKVTKKGRLLIYRKRFLCVFFSSDSKNQLAYMEENTVCYVFGSSDHRYNYLREPTVQMCAAIVGFGGNSLAFKFWQIQSSQIENVKFNSHACYAYFP